MGSIKTKKKNKRYMNTKWIVQQNADTTYMYSCDIILNAEQVHAGHFWELKTNWKKNVLGRFCSNASIYNVDACILLDYFSPTFCVAFYMLHRKWEKSSPAKMCVVELPFKLYCTVNVCSNNTASKSEKYLLVVNKTIS